MWINYRFMLVCPLSLTLVAQIFQKVACFWSSPNFYPNLPIFLHGYIRHIRDIFHLQVNHIDPSFIVGAKDKDESIAMFAFQGRGNGWVDRGKHCLCPKKQFPANRQTLRLLIVSFFTNILHFAIKQIRRSLMIFSFFCNAM